MLTSARSLPAPFDRPAGALQPCSAATSTSCSSRTDRASRLLHGGCASSNNRPKHMPPVAAASSQAAEAPEELDDSGSGEAFRVRDVQQQPRQSRAKPSESRGSAGNGPSSSGQGQGRGQGQGQGRRGQSNSREANRGLSYNVELDEKNPMWTPALTDEDLDQDPPGHRSGYVAVIGKPNAGKSTLINAIVGQKLSIVSAKPQTTRHRVVGIASDTHYQVGCLDAAKCFGSSQVL